MDKHIDSMVDRITSKNVGFFDALLLKEFLSGLLGGLLQCLFDEEEVPVELVQARVKRRHKRNAPKLKRQLMNRVQRQDDSIGEVEAGMIANGIIDEAISVSEAEFIAACSE
jgi:hypothetical protein